MSSSYTAHSILLRSNFGSCLARTQRNDNNERLSMKPSGVPGNRISGSRTDHSKAFKKFIKPQRKFVMEETGGRLVLESYHLMHNRYSGHWIPLERQSCWHEAKTAQLD